MRRIITATSALSLFVSILCGGCGLTTARAATVALLPIHRAVVQTIYTPAALTIGMTQAPRYWDGRVVIVTIRAHDVSWGWGSDGVAQTYQLAVNLPADRANVSYSFNIDVRPGQMNAARAYARAHHSHLTEGTSMLVRVRLLRRDTQIMDTPVVADAVYLGTARQLAGLASAYQDN